MTIRGAAAWISATVLVWLVGAVASAVLPLLLVKRAVRSRRSDRSRIRRERPRGLLVTDAAITLVVLAVVVGLFVWNRLPVEVIAIGSALALFAFGVLSFTEAIAGFGDSTVVMIAALFVVSEGLDSTGVTAWIGQRLIALAGDSKRRLLVFTMLLAAGLTAMINLTGAVAALLPMAVMVAVRQQLNPSRLLMPMVFAASAGSLLLLTGSPVNVIFADAAEEAGVGRFGFAEFALVGIPVVVGTIALLTLVGDRLLPDRGGEPFRDLSQHAGTLVQHYSLERFAHLRLAPESQLVGRSRGDWDLTRYAGLNVITVVDGESGRPVSDGVLAEHDRLTVTGDPVEIERYAADKRAERGGGSQPGGGRRRAGEPGPRGGRGRRSHPGPD